MEQIGSAIIQPNWFIRMAEIITPTLPKVSARMWRKTPEIQIRKLFQNLTKINKKEESCRMHRLWNIFQYFQNTLTKPPPFDKVKVDIK